MGAMQNETETTEKRCEVCGKLFTVGWNDWTCPDAEKHEPGTATVDTLSMPGDALR